MRTKFLLQLLYPYSILLFFCIGSSRSRSSKHDHQTRPNYAYRFQQQRHQRFSNHSSNDNINSSSSSNSNDNHILSNCIKNSTAYINFLKKPLLSFNNNHAIVAGLKNAAASGLATAVSKTILAPFDTLKTVQQQEKSGAGISLLHAYRRVTSRNGGLLELYSGLGVAVIGAMPSVGLYFGVYAYCKRTITPSLHRLLCNDDDDNVKLNGMSAGQIRTLGVALSAAIGNTVASFSRVPYEVVKQKLQTGMYAGTFTALSSMWKEDGFRAFFPMGGVSSQMVRDIPYAIFTLMTYECLRENWVERVQRKQNLQQSAWRNMVAGAIAGGVGSYLTNPMDVVKTRLQTDVGLYEGVMDCARTTYATEGASAFLKGVKPRLMHKVPANAFFFLSFEIFRKLFNVDQLENKTALSEDSKKSSQ